MKQKEIKEIFKGRTLSRDELLRELEYQSTRPALNSHLNRMINAGILVKTKEGKFKENVKFSELVRDISRDLVKLFQYNKENLHEGLIRLVINGCKYELVAEAGKDRAEELYEQRLSLANLVEDVNYELKQKKKR